MLGILYSMNLWDSYPDSGKEYIANLLSEVSKIDYFEYKQSKIEIRFECYEKQSFDVAANLVWLLGWTYCERLKQVTIVSGQC